VRLTKTKAAAVLAGALVALAGAACSKPADEGSGEPAAIAYPTKTVHLMAPAAAGGGWDSTARSLQKTLKDANLTTQSVEVTNVPGAAGTVGLAQFMASNGDAHQLMVMGLVMLGGEILNKTPVKVTQTTPIATLTAEAELIVVKSDSKYKTLKELVDDVKANPTAIKIGGGSAGGTDHILLGLVAKAGGIDAGVAKNGYVAYSGGGELKNALLSGDVGVGISSVSEFKDLIAAGTLRPLAVSAATPATIGTATVPTIKESGYDVELMNWRGVVAAPGISAAERAAIIKLVDDLHKSSQWQATLTDQGWEDFYKSGDEAKAFFESESTKVAETLAAIGLA
jgi:putative tricarboxylic transport membrane protein